MAGPVIFDTFDEEQPPSIYGDDPAPAPTAEQRREIDELEARFDTVVAGGGNQPRDGDGKWTKGGAGYKAPTKAGQKQAAAPTAVGEPELGAGRVIASRPRPVTQHGDGRFSVETSDGKRVNARPGDTDGLDTSSDDFRRSVRESLAGVADAYELDPSPNGPPEVVYHSDGGMRRQLGDRAAAAWVDTDQINAGPTAHLNVNFDKADLGAIDDDEAGSYMPAHRNMSMQDRGDLRATMMHEYGHIRMAEQYPMGSYSSRLLFTRPAVRRTLSTYGQQNQQEAEAEAYLEWHATKGTTKHKAAKVYAETLAWRNW